MPPPIPRCSNWAYSSLHSPSYFSLPRYGSRIGLHIFLFEACSTFTRVAACTLALSPIRDTLIEGFSHFVTSMTAPIASGWRGCRMGFAPTGKRRLCQRRLLQQRIAPGEQHGVERSGFRETHAHLGLIHADPDARDHALSAKLVERHIGAGHRFAKPALDRIDSMGPDINGVDQ